MQICNKSGARVEVFTVFLWLLVFLFIILQFVNE